MTTSQADVRRLPPLPHPLLIHSAVRFSDARRLPLLCLAPQLHATVTWFIEPPVFLDDLQVPSLDCTTQPRGCTIGRPSPRHLLPIVRIVPRLPVTSRRSPREHAAPGPWPAVRALVQDFLHRVVDRAAPTPLQWFLGAAPASSLLGAFNETLVVYERLEHPARLASDAACANDALTSIDAAALREHDAWLAAHADLVVGPPYVGSPYASSPYVGSPYTSAQHAGPSHALHTGWRDVRRALTQRRALRLGWQLAR